MVGVFFTKPLQGSLFRVFRDVLLGYKHTSVLASYPGLPTEERVGMVQSEYRDTVRNVTVPVQQENKVPASWADVVRGSRTGVCVEPVVTGRSKGVVLRELILSKQSRV